MGRVTDGEGAAAARSELPVLCLSGCFSKPRYDAEQMVPRPPFPKTLREFQSKFASEEACQRYSTACRWPDGFVCSRCGGRRAYEFTRQRRWQCAGCRRQVSLTAGTILHNTKTPLTVWFWAAYLMTTDKRGLSALLLQRQLALSRYETAWLLLHKFRRAMVNLAHQPLRGEVQVDETWVGGTQAGLRGSRQLKGLTMRSRPRSRRATRPRNRARSYGGNSGL